MLPVLPVHKDNAQNDDFNAIVNQNQGNFNSNNLNISFINSYKKFN